jgi:hypothetical protein
LRLKKPNKDFLVPLLLDLLVLLNRLSLLAFGLGSGPYILKKLYDKPNLAEKN